MTINESIKAIDNLNMVFKSMKKKKIRCVENGRTWDSIADLAREYELPYHSVASSINSQGKYNGYHFEYVK